MRGSDRLVVPATLAGAWLLVHALPFALAIGPTAERVLGRTVVLAFLASLLVEALRALPAGVRADLLRDARRPSAALRLMALWFTCSLLPALVSGVVRFVPRTSGTTWAAVGVSHGPLTAWPHFEVLWPGLGIGLQVGLGRALVLATLGLLVALAVVVVRSRVRPQTRGGLARAWPALLAAPACPACLTPTLALALAAAAAWGGAGVAPAVRRIGDPLSQVSALLEVAAPLVALFALARLGGSTAPARPVGRAVPVVALAAFAAPALAALPLRMQVAALMPAGASNMIDAVNSLFLIVTIVAVLLFLPVVLLIVYYPLRYRDRGDASAPPDGRPMGRRARRTLIAVYTIVPAILILGLGVLSVDLMLAMESEPEGTMHVNVTGEQFNWTFTMPDGSVSENVLRVPQGEVVVLHVSSVDVVHSFYVPALGVRTDALPYHDNDFWFRATRPGEYQAHCAEFCGFGHTHMRASVIVEARGGAAG